MKLYNRLYELAPNDPGFEAAPELTFAVKRDVPATAAQLRYLAALVAKHNVKLDEKPEELTKSRASRIIDGIISTYGK
jgi:DNA polymerase-3 subunit alpha (Gram-positive type)